MDLNIGKTSETQFRHIADIAPLLIWTSGPDKGCTYFNRGWLEFTGRTVEQELGNGWAEGVHQADHARCLEIRNSAHDRRERFEMEYRLRRADGAFRWIHEKGAPNFSLDGEFLGFIGGCIEIHDRKEVEEALQNLTSRLINAQEDERIRLAGELHDDLSQRLAVLSIRIGRLARRTPEEPDKLHARINELWTDTEEISAELHRLSYRLHPSKLDHLGLAAAIRTLGEEIATSHELRIKFQQKGLPTTLSKEVSLCVFRIAQESLRNVVKHSGAREARIVLEETPDAVRLSVSDSGCGFDVTSSDITRGLGFTSMRERLRLVGGQISIRSHPSQGTEIEVTVPLTSKVALS